MPTAARDSKNGFGLIEALIGVTLGMVLFSSAAYLLHTQVSAVRRMKTQLELLSLQLDIQRAFSSPTVCLENFASITIDENQIGNSNYAIALTQLSDEGTPPLRMLASGQLIPDLTLSAIPESIHATNIEKLADNAFMADISSSVRDHENRHVFTISLTRIRLATDPITPSSAKVPTACRYGGESGAGGSLLGTCRTVAEQGPANFPFSAMCNADEVVVSGGGRCLTGAGLDWDEPAIPPNNQIGYVFVNHPVQAGPVSGWRFDCYNPHIDGDYSRTEAIAYCCRR